MINGQRVSIYLSTSTKKKLELLSKHEMRSQSKMVEYLILKYINDNPEIKCDIGG